MKVINHFHVTKNRRHPVALCPVSEDVFIPRSFIYKNIIIVERNQSNEMNMINEIRLSRLILELIFCKVLKKTIVERNQSPFQNILLSSNNLV